MGELIREIGPEDGCRLLSFARLLELRSVNHIVAVSARVSAWWASPWECPNSFKPTLVGF